jgi:MFS family permease
MKFRKIRFQWGRFKRHFTRFTWGGAWAAVLPEKQRRNLTLFFYDGLFAAASDKIVLTYLSIYMLSLGASQQQVGLLSSLSNLAAALLLLPAAMMVEHTGKRKQITLASSGGSRLVLLLLALLPLLLGQSKVLIWVFFGLALLRETFNNISYPGWIALTGDLVPLAGRGRYFGTRNFIMGLSGIITALVIGQFITWIGEPLGYQVSFFLAVVLGVISMSFFGRIKDPQHTAVEESQVQNNIKEIFASLKGETPFILYCVFTALWNFSINIAGPFFSVYMVDTLHFTAAMIGIITVSNAIANMVVQRRIGSLADRLGNRNLSIIFLLLIPFIPLIWGVWVQTSWQAILIEVLSGIAWGAYNLVSFNTLLTKTPEKQRARFSAFYQIVVTLSLGLGAAVGSYLIPLIHFKGVTILSAAGRLLAGILFILLVKDNPPAPETED